jgi:Domain of unknown function (DUF4349)
MTMLDDDQLATLFARAAADFELPESGPAEILVRARRDGAQAGEAGPGDDVGSDAGDDAGAPSRWREGRLRRAGATAARHRVLTVAACLVVLLSAAGIVGALDRGTSSPTATSSLRPVRASTPPRAGSSPVTTTSPPFGVHHAGPSAGSAAAPSHQPAGARPNASLPSPTVPGQGTPSLPNGAVGQPARIEQTGSLGLTVKPGALNRTMTQLSAIATGAGGFVASSQTQTGTGSDEPPSGTITLQVPVADFAGVLKQAQALGKTSNLTTKATDVTGQYVDLQARIDALEATRQQYLTIMAKATSIGDVLSVQEELDSVQTQIEQLQGQLQLLSNQTAYSTATITVNERGTPPRSAPVPESGVGKSWHDSLHGFAAGVEGVIRYAGPVLFAVLCLGLVWLGSRTLWRRYQRHNL